MSQHIDLNFRQGLLNGDSVFQSWQRLAGNYFLMLFDIAEHDRGSHRDSGAQNQNDSET